MDKIPKKFQKVTKSFMDRISSDAGKSGIRAFCAFPQGVHFSGRNDDETIVLMVRRDIATLIPQAILVFVFLASPLVFTAVLRSLDFGDASVTSLILSSSLIFILLAITVAVDTFLKWFYTVNIITDERVVDVDFSNVMYHSYNDAQLEKIEDVTHKVSGLLGALFDYGTVYIQTAGLVHRENSNSKISLDREMFKM
ncbi:hypothetical protein KC622_00805 [Candidatus Dojkabacteria bacterium]|uniref:DUF304 domain-containing protein n=1 Tax=Candidatus Dojkabacteria bacterium TaxID=2099670 RepID=A0A955HXI0_9BACT|nr:hypothetical protein [Candidatus Dojkabacteria bacterium]